MLQIGDFVGNYHIVRKLGEGGMGVVFEAVHEQIGRHAAVKALHPHLSQNGELATRFLHEARAVNVVSHPGVVQVFEYGHSQDGTVYIVMELLKGDPLSRRLSRGAIPPADVMRIGRQIASAVAAAHEKGIVHRDLKPDNVYIVPDPEAAAGERAKILDFGIAKLRQEDQGPGQHLKTRAGTVLGTPPYMSPEQCRGTGDVNGQSDVYSLGIMLYEMLTGQVPFQAEGLGELMAKHIYDAPVPLRTFDPAIPEGLAGLVHAMLAKAPADRPTMVGVVKELERMGARRTAELPAAEQPTLHGAAATPVPARPVTEVLPKEEAPARITAVIPAGVATSPANPPDSATLVRGNKRRFSLGPVIGGTLLILVAAAAGLGWFFLRPPPQFPVTVLNSGPGEVRSEPSGISCGSLCTANFAKGIQVRLEPHPDSDARFVGWSGACVETETCIFHVYRATTVQARFRPVRPASKR
jgi:serine/threonine protein kinase